MIWLMTWRTLTSKTVETRMMKAGRQRTRWRQSRMTASSPSPNTLVAPLTWVYYDLVIRQIQSVKPFTFLFPSSVQARCSVWVWILPRTAWRWQEERMTRRMSGGWAMEKFCWSAQVSVEGRLKADYTHIQESMYWDMRGRYISDSLQIQIINLIKLWLVTCNPSVFNRKWLVHLQLCSQDINSVVFLGF